LVMEMRWNCRSRSNRFDLSCWRLTGKTHKRSPGKAEPLFYPCFCHDSNDRNR
jgi:hypothetical protein